MIIFWFVWGQGRGYKRYASIFYKKLSKLMMLHTIEQINDKQIDQQGVDWCME
jgi:hypothetical protein